MSDNESEGEDPRNLCEIDERGYLCQNQSTDHDDKDAGYVPVMLCYVVMLCNIMLYIILYCVTLHYKHYITLQTLHYITLHWFTLYYIILYYMLLIFY